MAERKFVKGSKEFIMFQEFWVLAQKYAEPDNNANESFFDEIVAETNSFAKKYKNISMAKHLALAICNNIQELNKAK